MRLRAFARRSLWWSFRRSPRRWSVPRRDGGAPGYVYVIQGEGPALKIGSSNDPQRRRRELQTGSAAPLRIIHSVAVSGDPSAVEFAAHGLLGRHRISLEWFDVPPDLAVGAIYAAAYRLGALGGMVDAQPRTPAVSASLFAGMAAAAPFWAMASYGRPLEAVAYLSMSLAVAAAWHLLSGARGQTFKWIGVGAMASGIAFAAMPARSAETVPTINGGRYCASLSGFVNDNALIKNGCLEAEARAERHVRALWAETPASVRTQCMNTLALVTPSYQRLSGCMSLTVGTMWMNGELKLTPR